MLVILTFGLFIPTNIKAGVLQQIVRKAGKVADDVPLRPMEETMSSPSTRKMAEELMQKPGKIKAGVPYSRALIQEIKTTSSALADPKVLKALDTLDDAGLEVVMLASRGAKNVEVAVKDIGRRAEFLRKVDGDTLCVLGRYDDLADEAINFQKALANPSNIPSPVGMRRVTLDDFGKFFKKFGEKGHDFWMKTIKPHWKFWAATTAISVILFTPEEDLENAIDSVVQEVRKVTNLSDKVIKESLGLGGEIAEKTLWAILAGFFNTWFGACFAIIGGILILLYVLSNPLVQGFFRKIGKMCVSIKKFVCPKRS